ncbi:hypothetical protein, partial [Streptomyces sp. NPDC055080]
MRDSLLEGKAGSSGAEPEEESRWVMSENCQEPVIAQWFVIQGATRSVLRIPPIAPGRPAARAA